MNDDMTMMMQMTFYWGMDATVLFDWWVISSAPAFWVSWVAVVAASALRHGLVKVRTDYVLNSEKNKALGRYVQLVHFALAFAIYAFSGLSMLVMMTFNGPLFLAVVLGEAVGSVWLSPVLNVGGGSYTPLCH